MFGILKKPKKMKFKN